MGNTPSIHKQLTLKCVLATPVAFFAAFFAAGCSQSSVVGSCDGAQVQALSNQPGPLSGELPPANSGLGGYIVFGSKRCSALVRFESRHGKIQGIAFTARHCGRDSPGADDGPGVTLDLFTPQGYITAIPINEEFSTRRAALVAQARSLESTSPAAARILRHFSTTTPFSNKTRCSEASNPSLYVAPDPLLPQQDPLYERSLEAQSALQSHTPSHTASCWMYAEVGVYPFELDAGLFQKGEYSGLEELVKQDESSRNALAAAAAAVAADSSSSSVSPATRERWEHDLLALTGRSRILSHASGVDFLRWCHTAESLQEGTFAKLRLGQIDINTAKQACDSKTQIQQALVPYFKEKIWTSSAQAFQSFDVFEKASTKGLSPTEPLMRLDPNTNPPSTTAARYFLDDDLVSLAHKMLSEQQAERLEKMTDQWQQGVGIPSVSLNIAAPGLSPSSLGALRFAHVPLSAFHSDKNSFVIDKTPLFDFAFRIFLKKEGSRLSFSRGDSGSLLTLDGYVPVAALNGIGDDVTSAGASVITLPTRRARTSQGPAAPASAERRAPAQTSEGAGQADCG